MAKPRPVKLRATAYVTLLAIGCGLPAWAKDLWEDRAFSEWTAQEAMK